MLKITDSEFSALTSFIQSNYGVDLRKKRALIEGRLGNYIPGLGFASYMEYLEFAKKDPTGEEIITLLNRLTTNHTYFMRERDHFDFYGGTILPWIDRELRTRDLRVWCAGCSTGQEPYTLAVLTLEYLGQSAAGWEHTILSSDISDKALDAARQGLYPKSDLAEMPPEWVKKYFKPYDENRYSVTEKLKASLAFRRFNLLDRFTFRQPFQAIFCRNVMIYFDIPTKNTLINKFYDALLPGGYLLIGHSESLSSCTHSFKYVMPSVYRK
ncbi:MAG: protein-glutamate O-methyltransferase CheR [Clostridiales Family XIII bacterium]|jgi:chemotaxis protein methyltransferase CheR|nr:protein-glutamate O-methyltransferase CheR [Clostridiales Family XIII bacterium]